MKTPNQTDAGNGSYGICRVIDAFRSPSPEPKRSAEKSEKIHTKVMEPRDIFGIIIRTFGLSLFIYAIWYLVYGVATIAGLPEDAPGYLISYFITGGTYFVIGLYLLRGAPFLIRFAYPPITDTETEKPN